LFVFFTLVAIRGVVALCAGPNAAAWLGTVLQIVTVVLLVEVLFFLSTVLSSLVRNALDVGASHAMLPPVWFAALYAAIAGAGGVVFISRGQSRALDGRPRERASLSTTCPTCRGAGASTSGRSEWSCTWCWHSHCGSRRTTGRRRRLHMQPLQFEVVPADRFES